MDEVSGFKTREDFARSFVPAFKQAVRLVQRIAAGEQVENDFEQHIQQLMAEAEKLKAEGAENED